MPMAKGRVSFRMTSFAMKACIPILCHCVIFGPTESRVICPPGARRRPGRLSDAPAGVAAAGAARLTSTLDWSSLLKITSCRPGYRS